MEDIFSWYKQGLLFYGPYRAYFGTSRSQLGEYKPKAQLAGEHRPVSEPARKAEQNETIPNRPIENKTENSQKIENKKERTEQNEISPNGKIGLPEYQQNKIEQTSITKRSRPASYYDKSEFGW